ncbi:hypothetical protein BKA56DRAFT_574532 [Ilyonectria sp. MPI-CAGE-AT-0026]|nr:hypothetical protein BKA56DRAFT_574532 [Ilyonectria sp. MPI-CAGE-AT-0026]
MPPKSVLLFGASGYIGGALLSQLHAKYGSTLAEHYRITLATRSIEKGEKIKAILPGSQTIKLSLQDHAEIEREAQKHEIDCQIADCDDLEATHAILRGLKARKEATGLIPALYHTSGALIYFEDLGGRASSAVISDLDSDKINAIPIEIPHRNVDNAIVEADEAGYVLSYILVPTIVFGKPSGVVHDHGLANATGMAIGHIVRPALDRRAVGQIGPGENLWSVVHVDDVALLHLYLLENPPSGHGRDGFYNAEHGNTAFHVIAEASARTLSALGVTDTDRPTSYTSDELSRYQVPFAGWNLICRGDRARRSGWTPEHYPEEFEQYVVEETKRLVFQLTGKF